LLQGDPKYPLNAYPSTDRLIAGQAVGPFNPGQKRYPAQSDTGFDQAELLIGDNTYQTIAEAPPAACASKLFNIRGIQSPTGSTTGSITGAR
jgi:hypothetical protein